MSDTILIREGIVVTLDPNDRIIENGFVKIDGNQIVDVGPVSALRNWNADRVIDARRKIVMPGLISGHTHAALTLLRGLGDGLRLDALVKRVLWPFESALKPQDSLAGAKLGCLEMIKAGVTTFADMHFNMDAVAKAVEASGIRASLSVAMMDRNRGPTNGEDSVKENEALVRDWNRKADGRITCMFGPCTVRTASIELFRKARELADRYGVGLHIHLSEVKKDVDFTIRRYRKRPVRLLNDEGILRNDVIAAHSIWLDQSELRTLSKRGVSVVHNPVSNARTGAGAAPVAEMLKHRVNVGLGADAAVCNNTLDMFLEMRGAALIAATRSGDPNALPSGKLLRMATMNNARGLGLAKEVGCLEAGRKADVIILDGSSVRLNPLVIGSKSNIISHLVNAANGGDVETTIIDGKVVMLGRQVQTLNEREVIEEANLTLHGLLSKVEVA